MRNKTFLCQAAISTFFLIFIVSIKIYAIDYTISFTGSGASTLVETVTVQNLTKGTTLNLVSGDLLNFSDATNAVEQLGTNNEKLSIYPNHVEGKFTMEFYAIKSGRTQINAYNLDGSKVSSLDINLQETV